VLAVYFRFSQNNMKSLPQIIPEGETTMECCALIFIPILAIVGVVIGVLIYQIKKTKHKLHVIADTPLSDVKDLSDGMGKVNGVAVALEETLISPMTQVECIFYHFVVEEQRTRTVTTGSGRHMSTRTETYWHPIINDKDAIGCGLEDDSGRAELELLDAEMVMRTRSHLHSGFMNDCPRHVERTLRKRYGQSSVGLIFNKTMRYRETVIREGDELFVIGNVEVDKGKMPYFSKGENPFIVSDKDEREVVSHFKTKLTWLYVGTGFAAVVFVGGVVALIAVLIGAFATGMASAPPPRTTQAQQASTDRPQDNPIRPIGDKPPFDPNKDKPVDPNKDKPIDPNKDKRIDPNKDKPVDPNKDKPIPPEKDAITKLLDDLNSNDVPRRKLAAESLGEMTPVDNRKRDVIPALHRKMNDPDKSVVARVEHAIKVWTGVEKPSKFTETKQPATVEWAVKVDPAEKLPQGALGPNNPIPIQPLPMMLYSTASNYPILATNPTNRRDSMQLVDLRQQKPIGKPIQIKIDPFNYQMGAISPDGAYLAAVTPKTAKPTVEVWSTATAAVIHRIEIEAELGAGIALMEFSTRDRLVTILQKGDFRQTDSGSTCSVWDMKTGKSVARYDFKTKFNPKGTALSPGGNYLAATVYENEGSHLLVIDLATGKTAGKLDIGYKPEFIGGSAVLSFSPNGEKIALLWLVGKQPTWARILSWDVSSQKKLCDHEVGYEVKNIDHVGRGFGGQTMFQWIPDGSGWLVMSHLLIDGESGAVVWRFGTEPGGIGNPHVRFLDRDHLSTMTGTGFNVRLTIDTIPWKQIDPVIRDARAKKKN